MKDRIPPLLSVQKLSFRFGDTWTLQDVDFEVPPGTILGIAGPNGSGKTTLLKMLAGLLQPHQGGVRLLGDAITALSPREIARRVAIVFQDNPWTFPISVYEMVALGRSAHLSGIGFLRPVDRERVMQALGDMALETLQNHSISHLSGGERQRVFIARALAQESDIMILDEPTTHLDIGHQSMILRHLAAYHRRRGGGLVMIGHDLNILGSFCQTILLLHEGRVAAWGPPQEVLTEQNIEKIYRCAVLKDTHPTTGTPRITTLDSWR